MDALVRITLVKDAVGFDPNTLMPLRSKVVTYMIGAHGPFTLSYHHGEYTQQRVEQDIEKEVEILRGLGVLPAS